MKKWKGWLVSFVGVAVTAAALHLGAPLPFATQIGNEVAEQLGD